MEDSETAISDKSQNGQSVEKQVEDTSYQAIAATKLAAIRNRFSKEETGDANNTSSAASKKTVAKVHYAGLENAKTKFISETIKVSQQPANKSDKPRRITPPRETVSVVENQPKPRDPNVVSCFDLLPDEAQRPETSKKQMLAKFKDIQAGQASKITERAVDAVQSELENLHQSKQILEKWKDIETGKTDKNPLTSQPINIDRSLNGGVYENQPTVRDDVIKNDSSNDTSISINAKQLRSAYLENAEKITKLSKVDPLAEIKQLSQRERVTVYENAPRHRDEGVISSTDPASGQLVITSSKDIREKFSTPGGFDTTNGSAKAPIVLTGEGGVYENQPTILEGVVRWTDECALSAEEQAAKWASDARQKFILEAQRSSKESSHIDAAALVGSNEEAFRNISDAKRRFHQMEEVAMNPALQVKAPKVVNIWKDIKEEDGGVFENSPKARDEHVVSAFDDPEEILLMQEILAAQRQQQLSQQQQQHANGL